MANIKSAKKRIRVIQKKALINQMRVSQVRTAVKRFEAALSAGDVALATQKLQYAQKKLTQVAAKDLDLLKNLIKLKLTNKYKSDFNF